MRFYILLLPIILFSCGENAEKKETIATDSITANKTITKVETTPSITKREVQVNAFLQSKLPGQWVMVNDEIAKWPKDVFDYFIAAKRKADHDYPYLALGDFNVDGKRDYAMLVTSYDRTKYRIAIALDTSKIIIWDDDVQGAAINTHPKEDLGSIDGKKAKLKGEAINVEFFEKSAWVLYWDGKTFQKIWTAD